MKNTILFICTGNYYRSRFAEEYFNHLADKHKLDWAASSKGLSQNMPSLHNPGSISVNALEALEKRNIVGKAVNRNPQPVGHSDFTKNNRIIAMSELEHRPMLAARFNEFLDSVEFFEVGDLPLEEPKEAMDKIAMLVDDLVSQLLENKKVA